MGSIEAIEGIIARSRLSSAQMDFRNFWYRQGQSSEWSEAQSLEHACQGRWWLGVPLKRMKQISYGKQRTELVLYAVKNRIIMVADVAKQASKAAAGVRASA
jgi:hypothetical protein